MPVEIVSSFDHNSWLCCVDGVLKLVNHDLVLSSDFCPLLGIPLPGNDRSSREFQRFYRHPEESWLSKAFVFYPRPGYFLVRDKHELLFSDVRFMRLFSTEHFAKKAPSDYEERVLINISLNGDFVYLSNLSTDNFTLCKLPLQDKYSKPLTNKFDYLIVRDGVIFYSKGHACIPELWNSDVTKCLSSFDQLTDTTKCLSVSDEVIACVCKQTASKCRIIFFNVSNKEIVKEMIISKNSPSLIDVHACSIKYHVLSQHFESYETLLWKDGEKMDGWKDVFYQLFTEHFIYDSQFSPDGNKLAISCFHSNKISIFDIASEIVQAQIATDGPSGHGSLVLKFFDNENLLYSAAENMLHCINTNSCKILTCLEIGASARNISVCRKRNIVCVGLLHCENFKLVTVCPPRRSHTNWI